MSRINEAVKILISESLKEIADKNERKGKDVVELEKLVFNHYHMKYKEIGNNE